MRRRTFDTILSITGFVLAFVLLVAGILLMWGGRFATSTVHDQLAAQKISFDSDASSLPADLQQYAGQQVTTGSQAKAYSDLIAVHLKGVADGRTYSEVSGEWIAGGMTDATLAQQRQTLFMGETLRGLLLNAYAFSIFGIIATIAAWVSLAAALVLFVLAVLGVVHSRRTPTDEFIGGPARDAVTV